MYSVNLTYILKHSTHHQSHSHLQIIVTEKSCSYQKAVNLLIKGFLNHGNYCLQYVSVCRQHIVPTISEPRLSQTSCLSPASLSLELLFSPHLFSYLLSNLLLYLVMTVINCLNICHIVGIASID